MCSTYLSNLPVLTWNKGWFLTRLVDTASSIEDSKSSSWSPSESALPVGVRRGRSRSTNLWVGQWLEVATSQELLNYVCTECFQTAVKISAQHQEHAVEQCPELWQSKMCSLLGGHWPYHACLRVLPFWSSFFGSNSGRSLVELTERKRFFSDLSLISLFIQLWGRSGWSFWET